jgi:arginyl-tRNA--protein-N-Asp/Glu arginylyltransferase
MLHARINLTETNYSQILNYKFIQDPSPLHLNEIYKKYCKYKKFRSVMPIFDSEYMDPKNDVIGYYHNEKLVAFSLLRRYDSDNVEAIQFAWDYDNPNLALGIRSLKNECAIYKEKGFKYMYLGGADEYKSKFDGFEILGPV